MTTNDVVKEVGKLIGVTNNDSGISTSHRLKHESLKPEQPAIIVNFTSRDIRNKFYAAKKNLRNKTTRNLHGFERQHPKYIYFAESLTRRNKDLLNKCLEGQRLKKVKFVWTSNGKIFMRMDVNQPFYTISNERDLAKYISMHSQGSSRNQGSSPRSRDK